MRILRGCRSLWLVAPEPAVLSWSTCATGCWQIDSRRPGSCGGEKPESDPEFGQGRCESSFFKVHTLARAIARMGLDQQVVPMPVNLASPEAILAVADCDVVFGCMDGTEGRHVLNRLATFYSLPYLDVGVRLDADGKGGISGISGAVHYLQPGWSSLLSRGVYSMDQVEAEGIRRTNPAILPSAAGEGYLRGIAEDRPAVVTVNGIFASLAVQEFLARIHPYRNQPTTDTPMSEAIWPRCSSTRRVRANPALSSPVMWAEETRSRFLIWQECHDQLAAVLVEFSPPFIKDIDRRPAIHVPNKLCDRGSQSPEAKLALRNRRVSSLGRRPCNAHVDAELRSN